MIFPFSYLKFIYPVILRFMFALSSQVVYEINVLIASIFDNENFFLSAALVISQQCIIVTIKRHFYYLRVIYINICVYVYYIHAYIYIKHMCIMLIYVLICIYI